MVDENVGLVQNLKKQYQIDLDETYIDFFEIDDLEFEADRLRSKIISLIPGVEPALEIQNEVLQIEKLADTLQKSTSMAEDTFLNNMHADSKAQEVMDFVNKDVFENEYDTEVPMLEDSNDLEFDMPQVAVEGEFEIEKEEEGNDEDSSGTFKEIREDVKKLKKGILEKSERNLQETDLRQITEKRFEIEKDGLKNLMIHGELLSEESVENLASVKQSLRILMGKELNIKNDYSELLRRNLSISDDQRLKQLKEEREILDRIHANLIKNN